MEHLALNYTIFHLAQTFALFVAFWFMLTIFLVSAVIIPSEYQRAKRALLVVFAVTSFIGSLGIFSLLLGQ